MTPGDIPGSDGYPIPAGPSVVEERVRRSRFLTVVARADSIEEARAFIESRSAQYADATHNCWAFQVGPPGSTARVGCSDDGEPQGTAGQPMLTALVHSGIGHLVAVSTRYYGGVKLGTGGLARAYGGGVKQALAQMRTARKVDRVRALVSVDYAAADAVRRVFEQTDSTLVDERFGANVEFEVQVPVAGRDGFDRSIADATRGDATVRWDEG